MPGLRWLTIVAFLAVAPAVAQTDAPQLGQISKDSVWVPTPERMIRRLLQMADVTKDDVVVDLGSGDGRIPIYAARHFGAKAIGVELEGNLIKLSRDTAATEGVSGLASFVQQDLYEFDLSVATVVALYISPGVMAKLKPRLLALKPGTRVVSHFFTLGDWEPDETVQVEGRTGYLWVVPASVGGNWTLRTGDDTLRVRIDQKGKVLAARGDRTGRAVSVIGAQLRGTEIRFTAFDRDGNARHYQGRIDAGHMSGRSEGMGVAPMSWTAVRD